MSRWVLGAVALVVASTFATPARADGASRQWEAKLSPMMKRNLANKNAAAFPAVIVLREQADLEALLPKLEKLGRAERGRKVYDELRGVALRTQAPLQAWLKSQNLKSRGYYISNFVSVENMNAAALEQVAQRAEVAKVIANPSFKVALPRGSRSDGRAQGRGIESSLTAMGAARVWQELGVRGENIVIAGQDTGVQWDHPALKANYRGTTEAGVSHDYSWHDSIRSAVGGQGGTNPCGFDAAAPCDDNGHGTHTVGTVVGDDRRANQIGVAPRAQWMACRNMDRGAGVPTTYIECFEYFLAPYPRGGDPMTQGDPSKSPHVINNSWGCPASEGCTGDEMIPVLRALWGAGIFVVASAGNEGPGCETIGAQAASVSDLTLSVGALNHSSGAIASFSSRGPSALDKVLGPDVAAPGVNIRSSVPGGQYAGFGWSGTSMAGPHVVGQIALIWSAKPALVGKLAETSDLIRSTATGKTSTQACGGVAGSVIPNNTFGNGFADAYKAVTTAIAQ